MFAVFHADNALYARFLFYADWINRLLGTAQNSNAVSEISVIELWTE